LKRRVPESLIAGLVALFVIVLVSHGRSTPYNNYVLLAQAFLHGHIAIDWPGSYIDALPYAGKYYVIEAPLPAVLLMPFVAIWGTANQTTLATVLGAVAIGAAYAFAERFGVPRERRVWLCAFLLAGTDLLWASMLGDVWFIAHVSAVCFTMLALAELAGTKRGWLVALFGACAAFSRFDLVLALPVYALLLDSRRSLTTFAAVLAPAAVAWSLYNLARWGVWYDIGYTAWYHQDQAGQPTGSPFRLSYLPYELWSFFVQAPARLSEYPWLNPSISGVALTWTSPALIVALLARKPLRWTLALWAAALSTAAPNFVYYVNGFAQFGMRHALDFEPFLFGLMVLALKERQPKWIYATSAVLIAYSVLAGFWGCWFWNAFIRGTS
jgi:hypothetical protein